MPGNEYPYRLEPARAADAARLQELAPLSMQQPQHMVGVKMGGIRQKNPLVEWRRFVEPALLVQQGGLAISRRDVGRFRCGH